ncbi:MAG TPA: hypothetical protein VH062_10775 [Polyangiaceae bacterium]|jgi:hypothetical protein|nr:hypothetical protein [Polyangiaceae bacterium]
MNSLKTFLSVAAVGGLLVACSSDKSTGGADGGSGGDSTDAGSGGKSATGGHSGNGGASGSGGGGASGASGSAGTAGTASKDAGEEPQPVKFSGTASISVVGVLKDETPLPGVSVCVVDASGVKDASIPCVATDDKGAWSFEFTPKQQLLLGFEKAGYYKAVLVLDVGTADVQVTTPTRLAAYHDTDGGPDGGVLESFGWNPSVTLDRTKGTVNLVAVQPAAAPDAGTASPGFDFTTSVTFTFTAKTGSGPYFVTPGETWDSTAKATVGGYGAWFVNVDPGVYQATATSTSATCVSVTGSAYGWAGDNGATKFPIIADTNTQTILFYCTPK